MKRLLVVDDEPQILELLELALSLEGYEVVTAPSGEVALEAAVTRQPDLIVLDVILGGMDGFETAQRLRGLTPVPIVFLTAMGTEQDRARGLALGQAYLIKPFRPAQLLEVIRAQLEAAAS
ncbi:DNA-binding response OmpR family regulator [Deinobacterium chartae]|uniref:DNA-binding response OmpR family regulator n=1 Tax=Deinobacterium chartae TaxID=521158 RepID=A0A841HXL1_9DEIO|nr:response regulator [Deinobacterium chartae]MBB6096692.1 DNA-binding response OmpR family regulator [Deinobacterium chartae]